MSSGSTERAEGAQGFDDRAKREAVIAERDGATLEHEPAALLEPPRELGEETALADSGLSANERERRLA